MKREHSVICNVSCRGIVCYVNTLMYCRMPRDSRDRTSVVYLVKQRNWRLINVILTLCFNIPCNCVCSFTILNFRTVVGQSVVQAPSQHQKTISKWAHIRIIIIRVICTNLHGYETLYFDLSADNETLKLWPWEESKAKTSKWRHWSEVNVWPCSASPRACDFSLLPSPAGRWRWFQVRQRGGGGGAPPEHSVMSSVWYGGHI